MGVSTDSNYLHQYNIPGQHSITASYELLEKAKKITARRGQPVHVGNVLSSDIFYNADPNGFKKWSEMGLLCAEMEATSLYLNASQGGAKALCILTISDHIFKDEKITQEARQSSFTNMIEVALELSLEI